MFQYRMISLVTLPLAMAYCIQLNAAEPISLRQIPFANVKKKFGVAIPGLLKSGNTQYQVNELKLLGEHQDHKKKNHVRMQQYYAGYPVFGGYAIFHGTQSVNKMWSKETNTVSMNGKLYDGLRADLGDPAVDLVTRGTDALRYFKQQYASKSLSGGDVKPMIYIDADNRAHWAYKVSILVLEKDRIPERPTAIVDAQTYQTYVKWNEIKTVRAKVGGRGFGGNIHSGLHQFGEELPALQLTRDDNTGICYMENARTKVVDMMHRYEGRNSPMHFVCPDSARQIDDTFLTGYKGNGYDKINGAYSPSNDALYAGNVIYDMYKKWYGMNPLEENGKAKILIMRVHFGSRYDNAFWDGEQMTFGDGGDDFYPLVSLGVGAHEISHGFTERHSALIYAGQSGGMNESFSDMAAQAAEYYATGKNDWTIGAELVKKSSGMAAFRYMDKPSRDGRSIDTASQYTPELDVHHTSGVYNRLFYLLSTQPGWDVRRAFEVMLSANADYWTPTSTFDEGACGILDAAKSFNYSVADVKRVLDQVDIHYSDCYDDSKEDSAAS